MTDLILESEYEGERLDAVLPLLFPDQSRSAFKKLIQEGQVLVSGKTVKPSYLCQEGDQISVSFPVPVLPEVLPENIPLDIVYEDADVILVNKPKNMVVHPAAGHYTGTLVNALLYHCKDLSGINGVLRPGIVHRIDKDTTGIVIACKNDFAHNAIADQLKLHSIGRKYRCIAEGNIREEEGTVNAPIGRHQTDRKKMQIRPDGKEAVTHYRVLERFGKYTYVECQLETGRTHQIRVHMTSIGHPLLGDTVYGKGKSGYHTEGQCLHAYLLGFVHPRTKEYLEFTVPNPEYFENILKDLRND